VDQHADALVAGSSQPQPLGLRGDPPIGLRDRDPLIIETYELLDESP
jgi:hypothetical protein